LAFGCGTYFVSIGKDLTGLTAMVTALTALVVAFIAGKGKSKKQIEEEQNPGDPGK
jgi:hypothetical protein